MKNKKQCRICQSKENLKQEKDFFDGFRNGVYVGVYSEINYYCINHLPNHK